MKAKRPWVRNFTALSDYKCDWCHHPLSVKGMDLAPVPEEQLPESCPKCGAKERWSAHPATVADPAKFERRLAELDARAELRAERVIERTAVLPPRLFIQSATWDSGGTCDGAEGLYLQVVDGRLELECGSSMEREAVYIDPVRALALWRILAWFALSDELPAWSEAPGASRDNLVGRWVTYEWPTRMPWGGGSKVVGMGLYFSEVYTVQLKGDRLELRVDAPPGVVASTVWMPRAKVTVVAKEFEP